MTVYVDTARHRVGRLILCHMWADRESELHAMADRIGVARRWYQFPPRASWRHYDVCQAKKALAIEAGAVLTDRFGPVEHVARLELATGTGRGMARGRRMLAMVERCRERRQRGKEVEA